MSQKFIIKVSKDKNLEIPPEIKLKLEPESEYEMTFNEYEITFKKIHQPLIKTISSTLRPASGKSLLRHSGTWEGDDFEECLQTVYDNRSQIEV